MSTSYTPDLWVVVKITPHDTSRIPHYRVFATWYGSYLQGQYYKINSGIVRVTKEPSHWQFFGSSGSVYHCYKDHWGTSAWTEGILAHLKQGFLPLGTIEKLQNQDWSKIHYE